jgi:hypothetical protein
MHSPDRPQPTKKTYRRPQLTVYGTVRALTQGGPVGPRRDGGVIINRNRS